MMAQTPSPAALNEAIPPDIASESTKSGSHTFNDLLSDAQHQQSSPDVVGNRQTEGTPSDAQDVPSDSAGTAELDDSVNDVEGADATSTSEISSEHSEQETIQNPDAVVDAPVQSGDFVHIKNGEVLSVPVGDPASRQEVLPVGSDGQLSSSSNPAGSQDYLMRSLSTDSLSTSQSVIHEESVQAHSRSLSQSHALKEEAASAPVSQAHGGLRSTSSPTAISGDVAFKDGAIRLDQGFRAVDASQNPVMDKTVMENPSAHTQSSSSTRSGVGGAAVMQADKVNAEIQKVRDGASSQDQAANTIKATGDASAERIHGLVVPVPSRSLSGANAQQLPGSGVESAQNQMEAGPPETLRGVSKGLSVLAQQRGGSLKMRLDPPSLGTVRLEMSVEAGRVSVQIAAANDSARALLQGNLGMLRTALEERGLAVDRLAVEGTAKSIGDGTAKSDSRESGDSGTRGGDREESRQDASQGRSRGRREHTSEQRWVQNGTDGMTDFEDVLLGA